MNTYTAAAAGVFYVITKHGPGPLLYLAAGSPYKVPHGWQWTGDRRRALVFGDVGARHALEALRAGEAPGEAR